MGELCLLFDNGWPYFEYHAFRNKLARHEKNWCADWGALQNAPRKAPLARPSWQGFLGKKHGSGGTFWRSPLWPWAILGGWSFA